MTFQHEPCSDCDTIHDELEAVKAERNAIDAERMKMREALERIEDECQCAAYQIARSVLYTQPPTQGDRDDKDWHVR